jgi:hypothetical protein
MVNLGQDGLLVNILLGHADADHVRSRESLQFCLSAENPVVAGK